MSQSLRGGGLLLFFLFVSFALPGSEKERPYTLAGDFRHGVSFFPRIQYRQTQPLKAGEIDFEHYHPYDEMVRFLQNWAQVYPDLVDLYVVAQSYEGRPIYQLTLTQKKSGPAIEKPAMYVEGNRHSGEVTSAEAAFYMIHHLLTRYGSDEATTALLDGHALYIRVVNNPDGADLYLKTAQSNRSTLRPHDSDRDGLLDEDPGEDLDGDGFLRQMRVRVGEDKGDHVTHPQDATGRLMKRVEKGKGNYLLYSEGIDNDGDGEYNEDGVGGIDLHRNYPENWRPEPGEDLTGRGWTQRGAGEYPLSEIETRSVVLFLLQRPHISIVETMDTAVPMHLRPPSTSRSEESMIPGDLRWYRLFDKVGKSLSGYPYAGDVYWDYGRLETEYDRDRKENEGSPLFGHSPDFGYFYYGAIWYGDELWNGGRVKDYSGDGKVDELEVLRWCDEQVLAEEGFMPWTKFSHPTLGEVEIGGYNPKFFRQNPPLRHLNTWVKKQVAFNLHLAHSLPRLVVERVEWSFEGDVDSLLTVRCKVANQGKLPTSLAMARRVKIVKPDRVSLLLPKGVEVAASEQLEHEFDCFEPGQSRWLNWTLRLKGPIQAGFEVVVSSTRGGVVRVKLDEGNRKGRR